MVFVGSIEVRSECVGYLLSRRRLVIGSHNHKVEIGVVRNVVRRIGQGVHRKIIVRLTDSRRLYSLKQFCVDLFCAQDSHCLNVHFGEVRCNAQTPTPVVLFEKP